MIFFAKGRRVSVKWPKLLHTTSDEKVFYMKNHLLEKLHPNSTRGTPLKIFRILKNLTEKKLRGFQDLERQKNSKKIKLSNGAPAHGAPLVSSRLQNSK